MFGDFWNNFFGPSFPFLGADRAGGIFGAPPAPEPGGLQHMTGGGAPPVGGPQMAAGESGMPGAPGGPGIARPAPTGAAVAQPPMGPVSSPLGPGGMAGGALSAIGPGQQRQPDRFGGGDNRLSGASDRLSGESDRLAEILRQFDLGGQRAS